MIADKKMTDYLTTGEAIFFAHHKVIDVLGSPPSS